MKKIIPIILLILLGFLSYFLLINKTDNKKTINYKLEGKNYRLLTATNEAEWDRGLMNYRKPDNFDGMLFIFPDKEYRNFWNKNTYMDLDVYWLIDDKVIGKNYLPSIAKTKNFFIINSGKKVNRVIEIIR